MSGDPLADVTADAAADALRGLVREVVVAAGATPPDHDAAPEELAAAAVAAATNAVTTAAAVLGGVAGDAYRGDVVAERLARAGTDMIAKGCALLLVGDAVECRAAADDGD